jgi:CheY-like chemotaxis protein
MQDKFPKLQMASRSAAGLPMLSRNTVLVIDADPTVRLAATRVLEPAGFTVMAAADVAAALAWLAVVSADLAICNVEALAPTGTSAMDAITDIDPSVQILTLFHEAARYRGHATSRRKRTGETVHPERVASRKYAARS